MAVDAGVAQALVDLGETSGVMVTIWTDAGEGVDAVNAGAAVVAGVDGTLIDVDVTHSAYKEILSFTFWSVQECNDCNTKQQFIQLNTKPPHKEVYI